MSSRLALATGNPLLMDKAEADAALARLQRAEHAHHRNQDALRHAIARHENELARLTALIGEIDAAIARAPGHPRRQVHHDRLKALLEQEITAFDGLRQRSLRPAQLGGFPLTAQIERSLGTTMVTLALDGAPGTSILLSAPELPDADPVGLITRLESRLTRLEDRATAPARSTINSSRWLHPPRFLNTPVMKRCRRRQPGQALVLRRRP